MYKLENEFLLYGLDSSLKFFFFISSLVGRGYSGSRQKENNERICECV